jgi:transposase-like protein
MTNLTLPMFTNETAAIAHMEADRWPNGVTCPLCGVDTVTKMGGQTQAGMFLCNGCRGKFTVRTGTVFERSHIPLHKWLLATHLMASSKKGISAHQLHRMLGITYKSAWFMAHRIREAMSPDANAPKIGGEGVTVEADETEIAPSRKSRPRNRSKNLKFVTLVERGGKVRSRNITKKRLSTTQEVRDVLKAHLHPRSDLHTDSANWYSMNPPLAASHKAVNHEKEFVRTTDKGEKVYTNSAEGYFSIFKRGLVGTYQIMSEQHLQRYLNEFDFRMNNRAKLGVTDDMRANRILKGAEGKRLTYRQPHQS